MKRTEINWPRMVNENGWRTVKGSPGFHSYFRLVHGVRHVVVRPISIVGWLLKLNGITVAKGDLSDMLERSESIKSGSEDTALVVGVRLPTKNG